MFSCGQSAGNEINKIMEGEQKNNKAESGSSYEEQTFDDRASRLGEENPLNYVDRKLKMLVERNENFHFLTQEEVDQLKKHSDSITSLSRLIDESKGEIEKTVNFLYDLRDRLRSKE